MIKHIFTIVLVALYSAPVSAFSTPDTIDIVLSKKLEVILNEFEGEAGVYVHHLKNGSEVALNANYIFSDSKYDQSAYYARFI